MWIAFSRDFTWSPPEKSGRVQIEFRSGMTLFVRRKCAEEAIAADAAEPITKETTNGPEHC